MKVAEALHKYSSLLRQHGLDEAEIDAKVILCHALDVKLSQVFAEPDRILSSNELSILEELISKRIDRLPVAYIVNRTEFYGMELFVNSRVLIPRPETELLVDEAVKFCNRWFTRHKGQIKIADVGTGSGAIALALAKTIPGSKIYAIDISEDALEIANINAQRHNLNSQIVFSKGDLLQQINDCLDIVIANLPYIPTYDIRLLAKEVSKYEPFEALNGGENGIAVIEDLVKQLPGKIASDGAFLLEIGMNQEEYVQSVIMDYFPGSSINLVKDLTGINRVVAVQIQPF